jgi:uncharacterized protein YraI
MLRKTGLFVLTAMLVLAVLAHPDYRLAQAQSADGWTTYQVNIRTGPGTGHQVITTLSAGTELVFEARNADISWLLVSTTDGLYRGWVAALYVNLRVGFGSPANLPISDEIVAFQPPAPAAAPAASFDLADIPALESVPVIPSIGPRVVEIFARGQALGNNPRVFAKVGDCNAASKAFMAFFGSGQYTLGAYQYLQTTIDFFSVPPAPGIANSFVNTSLAAISGSTSAAVLDPAWSDASVCPAGTSPLVCEYDRIHPAVALIMFGLTDIHWINESQYEQALRQIIEISIDRGVIPVLTTFPSWSGENDGMTLNKRLQFNTTIVRLSSEYGVPLVNFWRAAQMLPMCGLDGDLLHLSYSGQAWTSFTGDEQEWGFTAWNLIALQTLDGLRASVLGG